jgi:hypothetical protein
MIDIRQRHVYRAFGFTVSSDIALPELPVADRAVESAHIVIRREPVTASFFELTGHPTKFVVTPQLVTFHMPNLATFAVRDGTTIQVDLLKEEAEDEARLFILGTCMGAILLQRRILPLHGSAVAIDGKAYAIVGESGAGKSTLASAFLQQGYHLVSDDVIAVTGWQDEAGPHVTPSYPQQKLWQDSLRQLGMDEKRYPPLFARETKHSVPVLSRYCADHMPLAGIVELVKSEEDGSEIELTRIRKLERFHIICNHTYRNIFIPHMGLTEWHFAASVQMVEKVPLFRLFRPASGFTAPQLAASILQILREDEGA